MIYGYVDRVVNEEFNLSQMREISVAADPASLRSLAAFLGDAAKELEAEPRSVFWHQHVPDELRKSLGCDFIVIAPDDGGSDGGGVARA
ncbi:MAG TPA: hypothetical protein VHY91_02775 [Pirellulales bacterium]|jgi:hypothetical protein|nr:hypothetical protein [Pirellulales bacterium]